MQSPSVAWGWVKYLFFALVFSYQVERDCVESAGHDAEHAAEDERGHDVGKETNQAGAHAEHEVTHEVQRLQTDVRQQETLHVWKYQPKKSTDASCSRASVDER